MEINIEKYRLRFWLPDLSVARYFVATITPFLHVEHPSFKQLNVKLRPCMFFTIIQVQ